MADNVLVIWIAENVDERNLYCQEVIRQLYEIVDHRILLPKLDMCIRLVHEAHQEKLVIIASSYFGHRLAPQIDFLSQVYILYTGRDTDVRFLCPVPS